MSPAILILSVVSLYRHKSLAGVITYLACGVLSLVLGCLSFVWTPRDLLLTEVGLKPIPLIDGCFIMMACGSNGFFHAAETEDEEGLPGFRVVGRPATAGVPSSIPLQRHQPRTILERLPHETTFPGGRAIRFPVCKMHKLKQNNGTALP